MCRVLSVLVYRAGGRQVTVLYAIPVVQSFSWLRRRPIPFVSEGVCFIKQENIRMPLSNTFAATLSTAMAALVSSAAFAQTPPPRPSAVPVMSRWLEVQNATLNLRYRFIETTSGVVTTNQLQHRESLRGRVKFDKAARYSVNFGLFTGTRFTSGWDNTGWGLADAQKNLAFKAIYLSAVPVPGVEAQYGGFYILRGESTELTTYDEDGYVIGQRVSIRRPRDLYLDEISATVGYLAADPREIPISRAHQVPERHAELSTISHRQEIRHASQPFDRFHIL